MELTGTWLPASNPSRAKGGEFCGISLRTDHRVNATEIHVCMACRAELVVSAGALMRIEQFKMVGAFLAAVLRACGWKE